MLLRLVAGPFPERDPFAINAAAIFLSEKTMASPGPEARDKFDMSQSVETWGNFLSLAKWIVIGSLITLVIMAIFLTGGQPTY